MKLVRSILALALLLPAAFAQTVEWDNSGNNLLRGTYNFREALWITDAQASNTLDEAASQYGTITFDGQGNYTVTGSAWSSATTPSLTTYANSGVYAISASGFGFLRRANKDGGDVYGSVSNGVFIGSSTESGFNNLFIAALRPTTNPTAATFNQSYTIAYSNLATASLTQIRDATFRITPNGSGSLGTVSVTGYSGSSYTASTQTIPAASYSFTSGTGTLNLGTRNTTDLVSGSLQFNISADGQFIFGGATNGWDLFIGVRTPAATVDSSKYTGLYYQAGLDVKRSTLPSGTAVLGSYFGSFNTIASIKQMIGHERVQAAPDAAYDFTYSDGFNLSTTGSHDDFLGFQNFVSADGAYRIGFGRQDYLGLNVAVKAPTFISVSGPYVDPTGVVNAASYTPFTTGVAPGELITIFGTNLTTGNFVDATFPTTLGTVTVTINGKLAPIYVATPTQISAIVPYEISGSVAEIQVTRGAVKSNRVTAFINRTAPGVFAVPPTGLGYAAALHPNYALVTPSNPALPGETIAIYLTGLGALDSNLPTGVLGPINPLAKTVENLDVRVANRSATIAYSGLAPLLRGLYQLNVTIPPGTPAGDQYLDIGGPDTLNSQILLPIGGGTARSATEVPTRGRR